jgi:hypothetical protein
MKTLFIVLASAATLGLVAPATADTRHNCSDLPKSQWMSVEAITQKASALGYDVRRVKADGGCYEVYATDAKGARVEAYFHPGTGDVVKVEVE